MAHAHWRQVLITVCVAAFVTAGCKQKRERPSIGDQYEIVDDATTPVLEGTQLKVRVRYDRCADSIVLRHRVEDGAARIWLWRIDDPHFVVSAPCEKLHVFKVPGEALLQKSIVLYAPAGRRYVLQ
jgi:hypothetical protein